MMYFILVLPMYILLAYAHYEIRKSENRLTEIELELGIKTHLDVVKQKQKIKDDSSAFQDVGTWTK